VVRYSDLQGVYLDSCSGRVLGEQARWGGLFGTIEKLHRLRFLADGDLSELLSGTASVLFASFLVLGGLTLAWPRSWAQLRFSLKLPRGARGAALDVRLHRTAGLYVAVVLLASSVAAWTMTFDWARNVLYALTQSAPPAAKPRLAGSGSARADAETLMRSVLAAVPQADAITLAYPRKASDSVEVTVIEADAPHPNAKTMLYLDPRTAGVLRLEPYAASSSGYKLYRWLGAMHMGAIGGAFGQLLLLLGMAGVPVLAFTGIRSWLRRRRARPVRVPA
jgi:vanillate O-demethylase ferredoxin subunit